MDIVADKISFSIGRENGVKIATMEAQYPRPALAEFNTHRVFTRNGQSSRAVPFKRMVEAMRRNFHEPLRWLKNQPGMVATEVMDAHDAEKARGIWIEAMEDAIRHATRLDELHTSKQYVNRLLEPFMMTRTLVTSTKWLNFFKLRDHKDALPEFRDLAAKMKEIFDNAEFIERSAFDPVNGWHLPYVNWTERGPIRNAVRLGALIEDDFIPTDAYYGLSVPGNRTLLTMSTARCCRLSYKTFDGGESTLEKDLATFRKLATDPLHASPMEHQAFPRNDKAHTPLTGNFHGFIQFRKLMPNEAIDEAKL